jgi:HK97 family phage major capsid protein
MAETVDLENKIRKLNLQVQASSNRAANLQEEAYRVLGELKSRGVSLTSPDAVHVIGNVQAKLDEVAAEIAQATSQRQQVLEKLAGEVPGVRNPTGNPAGFVGTVVGGVRQLPLLPSPDDLERLRDAAESGQSLKVMSGLSAAVTGSSLPPAQIPDFYLPPDGTRYEPTRIATLIPVVGTDRPIVDYFRTTTGATAAASVAAGADKPQSDPVVEQVTATVVKLAHFGIVQEEVIADYAGWQGFLGTEFVNGLIHEENRQIISATGAGTDMTGLLATANVLSYVRDATNESKLDALASAITTLRLGAAFCDPDAIVMHPTDYLDVRLSKASTSGVYLAGDPMDGPANSLWGFPVVLSSQCTQGYAIVANLALAARIYWREYTSFQVAVPGGGGLDTWKANTRLIRAEERLVLAVHRPAAVVKVFLDT